MARKVFIIWANPLFRDTVCLLLDYPGIELVGMNSVFAVAHRDIEKLQPHSVIVEEAEQDENSTTISDVMQILETSAWCPRVILMSLKDNQLSVYYREQQTINTKEQLIQIIID